MQLLHLKYFRTVARHNSMSRAAEELFLSQPALSKAISGLEDELGVKLFDRVGRSVSLNEAGLLFYERILPILTSIGEAVAEAQAIHARTTSEIRLLISAANYLSNWLYQSFNARYEHLKLLINSYSMADDRDVAKSDFHLFASPDSYDNMESLPLMEEPLVLAMGKQHPLAGKDIIRLRDTRGYLYQCLPTNENLRTNLIHFCNKAGFQPKIGFSTEDSFTFFDVLSSHNYIAMVPGITAAGILNRSMILKPIEEPYCSRTIYLGWNAKRNLTDQDRQFIDFCRELFTLPHLQEELAEKTGWRM
ncbi:LysR family transcriptional regulator [Ruminococcaceae bacterium OttesenSCG-928-I18]|nr:LysR family transcriptional regulator [Ruminococcaceae bacterium OttesenSCG-928-I18]